MRSSGHRGMSCATQDLHDNHVEDSCFIKFQSLYHNLQDHLWNHALFFANSQVVAIAISVTAYARYPWASTFGRNWSATEVFILHAYHRLMRGSSHDIVHLLIKLDDISLVDSSYSCSHVDNVRDCQSGQSSCCCAVRNTPSVNPTPTTPQTYTALYARVVFPIGKGESASVGP